MKHPKPPNGTDTWIAILREIQRQTDRGAGIMGAAMVQDFLKQAIIARLFRTDESASELLGNSGPVGTFSSQISLAYAIGLIGKAAAKDLNYIRDIRNKFAHWNMLEDSQRNPSQVTFASQQIAAWCQNLTFPEKRHPLIWKLDINNPSGESQYVPPTEPRERYVHTCIWMAQYIKNSQQPNFVRQVPYPVLDY